MSQSMAVPAAEEFHASKFKLALDLAGLSQTLAAARMGISAKTVGALVKGGVTLSIEYAELASMATGMPLSFFILPGAELPEGSTTFRKTSTVRVGDERMVRAELSALYLAAGQLTEMADIRNRTDWIDGLAPRSTPSIEDIEQLAGRMRHTMGVAATGPLDNVIRRLEKSGVIVAPLSTPLAAKARSSTRIEGVTAPGFMGDTTVLGYFRGSRSGDGMRFTVAHEAGHALLQRHRSPQTAVAREREASLFAAALLMPRADAQAVISPATDLRDYASIKAGWGVSIASLITRAWTLGIIDQERRRSLMIQMSARHWRVHEPVHVAEEQPIYLKQLVGGALGTIETPTKVCVEPKPVEDFLGIPFDLMSHWANGLERKKSGDDDPAAL